MKRAQLALASLVLILAARSAHAQGLGTYQAPIYNPPISPYLNLIRGGNPAINYFGIVQPLQNLNAFEQRQLLVNNQVGNALATQVLTGIPQTGGVQTFMNYQGYFLTGGAGRIAPPPGYVAPIPWNGGGVRR